MVGHVTGRTDFDRMAVESVSQSIQYHFVGKHYVVISIRVKNGM